MGDIMDRLRTAMFVLIGLLATAHGVLFEVSVHDFVRYQPEQVHLSVNEDGSSVTVTWSTPDPTPRSTVEFSRGSPLLLDRTATGDSTKFVDGGKEKRAQYIHRVTLKDLEPNSTYFYHVGSDLGWSDLFWFRTFPNFDSNEDDDWKPSLAIYGDLGNANAQSLPRLQKETQARMYDLIFHVGDFAYNMDDDNGRVGDEFMRQIESIAAYVPYMTVAGNHEYYYNFSHYKNRFSMPLRHVSENHFYSFNMGPVHFVAVSTEFYYYLNYGIKMVENQFHWILKDLKEANLPENRAKRPWIVFIGHRPMYCSTSLSKDCSRKNTITRVGLPVVHLFGLEKLLLDYGVDLAVWAHAHSYERFWPVYDYQIYNGTAQNAYEEPRAPVHIITGSAGCDEKHSRWQKRQPKISAFRAKDYGYTRFTAHNKTHLHLQQVSDDKDGKVIDDFWIVKRKKH